MTRSPIIENEKISFLNLFNVLAYLFKKNIKYLFIISLLYFVYFSFFRTPFYTSKVSFYTNYNSSSGVSEMSILGMFGGFSDEPNNLKFSLDNYLESDKLFEQVVKNEYVINGVQKNLVEHWGSRYNNILSINPIQTFKNVNRKLALIDNISIENQKLLYSQEWLKRSIKHTEDKKSSLHTIKVVVRDKDPQLTEQIAIAIFNSILDYSKEVTSLKAKEKKEFISIRLNEIKSELRSSEDDMKLFLEKNKNFTSPNLKIQKDRIERDIFFYNQLYLSLSDQLEKVKINEKDTTTSIFLLDKASLNSYKDGASIFERLAMIVSFIFSIIVLLELFKHRTKYFQ